MLPLEVHGLFVAVVSLVAELGYAGALGYAGFSCHSTGAHELFPGFRTQAQ